MPDTTSFVPTDIWGIGKQLASGEGNVFKGAPNLGLPPEGEQGGSPQFGEAATQVNHYQGATPPGE